MMIMPFIIGLSVSYMIFFYDIKYSFPPVSVIFGENLYQLFTWQRSKLRKPYGEWHFKESLIV